MSDALTNLTAKNPLAPPAKKGNAENANPGKAGTNFGQVLGLEKVKVAASSDLAQPSTLSKSNGQGAGQAKSGQARSLFTLEGVFPSRNLAIAANGVRENGIPQRPALSAISGDVLERSLGDSVSPLARSKEAVLAETTAFSQADPKPISAESVAAVSTPEFHSETALAPGIALAQLRASGSPTGDDAKARSVLPIQASPASPPANLSAVSFPLEREREPLNISATSTTPAALAPPVEAPTADIKTTQVSQISREGPTATVPSLVRISLRPAELGAVQIVIRNDAQSTKVTIVAESEEGYSALLNKSEVLSGLVRDLRPLSNPNVNELAANLAEKSEPGEGHRNGASDQESRQPSERGRGHDSPMTEQARRDGRVSNPSDSAVSNILDDKSSEALPSTKPNYRTI